MSLRETTVTRLSSVRQYPADLAVVSLAAVLSYYVVTTYGAGSDLRLLAAIPLVLFFPGYALVSFLFPAAPRPLEASGEDTRPRGVDTVERLGLALALSIAIVPVVVIVLAATEWGLRAEPMAATFAAIAVGFAQLGAVRRVRRPATERFSVPMTAVFGPIRRVRGEGAVATATSILLVLAIVAAGVTLTAAFISPQPAGEFTELGLYTEDEDEGELVAGQFPDSVEPGESIPVVVGIENHEGDPREYTAVIQQQTVDDGTVTDRTELETVRTQVDDGEEALLEQAVTPAATDGTVRIAVLLYDGEPPAAPTRTNALEDTFFWVTIGDETDEDDELEVADEVGIDDEADVEPADDGIEAVDDVDDVDAADDIDAADDVGIGDDDDDDDGDDDDDDDDSIFDTIEDLFDDDDD